MLQRGYTRAVPATQIAQNLAFINWTVLTGLALGSYRGGRPAPAAGPTATPGYLALHGRSARSGSASWPGSRDGALPALARRPRRSSSIRPGTRRAGRPSLLFCVARRGARLVARRARPRGRLGARAGRRSPRPSRRSCSGRSPGAAARSGRSPLLVQLAVVSAAIGGVFAAMILGHWYLVTPKLPEAPLDPAGAGPARGRRRPGRAVRGLGRRPAPGRPTSRRSRRSSGRGRCSSGCA